MKCDLGLLVFCDLSLQIAEAVNHKQHALYSYRETKNHSIKSRLTLLLIFSNNYYFEMCKGRPPPYS